MKTRNRIHEFEKEELVESSDGFVGFVETSWAGLGGSGIVFREWFRKLSWPRSYRGEHMARVPRKRVQDSWRVPRSRKNATPDRPMKKGFLLIIFVNTVFLFVTVILLSFQIQIGIFGESFLVMDFRYVRVLMIRDTFGIFGF